MTTADEAHRLAPLCASMSVWLVVFAVNAAMVLL